MTKLTTIDVAPLNRNTKLILPNSVSWDIPEKFVGEYFQESVTKMRLEILDPALPGRNKRYPINRQNRSAYVTVPRFWLANLSAKPGDVLHVYTDDSKPLTFFMEYERV